MDYQSFKMKLVELVQKEISESVEISLERIPKNNGIYMEGIVFSRRGENTSPVIYVEEYYQYWKKGVFMEKLVEKIIWNYSHFKPLAKMTDDFFKDYDKLKSRIFYKIINYEKNREMLKKIPHRRILDLAMVFYYQIDEVEPPATILIQNSHLAMWDITEEELEENAVKYTCLCLPAEFLTMDQLAGIEEEDMDEMLSEERCPMYILTNKERRFGAGTVFYPGILKQAQKLVGDNFFILPSSIHECILIPEDGNYDQESLAEMVTEINVHHVDAREVLSDQAYYYLKKDGRIHI